MDSLFSVAGRTALVTGGARGLGRMIAEGLVRAGARVYITARKPGLCEQAAAEMSEHGECVALPADLASAEGAVAVAARLREAEEALHILVNNAGRTWGAPLASFPDHAWHDVLSVNLQAPFTLVRELLPELRRAGEGQALAPASVINIGSVAGLGVSHLSAYSYTASKAAIHALSKELAAELVRDNINVNAIAPGFFPSRMTAHMTDTEEHEQGIRSAIPMQRLGSMEDIAGLVILLSSRAGAYITGQVIPVDGGVSGCR